MAFGKIMLLHNALGIKISSFVGVSIGDQNDKSTWRVDLNDGSSIRLGDIARTKATKDAQDVLTAFDPLQLT